MPTAHTIGLRLPGSRRGASPCATRSVLLATTSANVHGQPPCTDVDAVLRAFPSGVVVVDGGRCAGAPSTVVSLLADGPRCLRQGAVAWTEVVAAAGD